MQRKNTDRNETWGLRPETVNLIGREIGTSQEDQEKVTSEVEQNSREYEHPGHQMKKAF